MIANELDMHDALFHVLIRCVVSKLVIHLVDLTEQVQNLIMLQRCPVVQ